MKSKGVYDGEWIKGRNMISSGFADGRLCRKCKQLHCGMVWKSIKTGEVRCCKCFMPEQWIVFQKDQKKADRINRFWK